MNFKLSSICTSVCGITNDSSAKHFLRLQILPFLPKRITPFQGDTLSNTFSPTSK
ncbi:hypothetical protein HanXRQr2_Chr14g0620881 [Helianthus annuus]|uniref:Uncharacterized protein n=1 Tax=Helianthus annuus TaxID=4232 RepID=A0A9K3H4N5_HELAN|nr:hypothetical protein HanXRQr2_Chr14g0620881 [Helianthus annuus]KAJ0893133.1 hypothetical protein HanPSC8_Chr09g0374151 [Helianthus annuus]